jgi:hypothetical protein
MKKFSELTLGDFDRVPVWELDGGAVAVSNATPRPDIHEIPDATPHLVVRYRGKLADQTPISGIATVRCPPPAMTVHSVVIDDQAFAVAFDETSFQEAAEKFAHAIGREPAAVFPLYVRAEIPAVCTGDNISQEIDITGPVISD